uniref:Uncharacterized protein n=1 Tax=Vespula pensylvanica TaxID=30213 RepID=A0A834NXJ3_VESPE|nr:hypothetical protein H0235_010554 [Vespula pensylvanica]
MESVRQWGLERIRYIAGSSSEIDRTRWKPNRSGYGACCIVLSRDLTPLHPPQGACQQLVSLGKLASRVPAVVLVKSTRRSPTDVQHFLQIGSIAPFFFGASQLLFLSLEAKTLDYLDFHNKRRPPPSDAPVRQGN